MAEVRHLSIVGMVQGVGFRAAFLRQAQSRDLGGWVRNRRDGSVEAMIAGEAEAVAGMIAWARRGPPGSRVDQVAVELGSGAYAGFQLRPSE